MELVIFDLETTGLSPRTHEIIQIAAVRMRHGEVLAGDRFETFVRPSGAIPGFISEITGITDCDVQGAPEIVPSLKEFSRFVGPATLVAHNGWRFDLPFIRAACEKRELPMREVPFFDSMTLSRRIWGHQVPHSLDAIVGRLNVPTVGRRRHDARGDVNLLSDVVCQLWRRLGEPTAPCPIPVEIGHLPA